jgi:protein-tyrosine-phosphatase
VLPGKPSALPVTSVLFACTHNAIRSPMAEAFLKHFHGRHLYVDSVGVRSGERDPFVVEVMAELGLDAGRHNPKSFDDLNDGSFDLVVSLSPEAQHRAVEMTRTMACDVEFWRVQDPTIVEGSREQRLEAYRAVRDRIRAMIIDRFPLPPDGD